MDSEEIANNVRRFIKVILSDTRVRVHFTFKKETISPSIVILEICGIAGEKRFPALMKQCYYGVHGTLIRSSIAEASI